MHSCSKAATDIYYLQPGWLLGKERRRRVVSLVESSLWGLVSTLLQTLLQMQRLPGLSDNWIGTFWSGEWNGSKIWSWMDIPTVLMSTMSPFKVVFEGIGYNDFPLMLNPISYDGCKSGLVCPIKWTNHQLCGLLIPTIVTAKAAIFNVQGFLLNTTTVVHVMAKFWCDLSGSSFNMTSDHSIKIMSITVVIKWETETEAISS